MRNRRLCDGARANGARGAAAWMAACVAALLLGVWAAGASAMQPVKIKAGSGASVDGGAGAKQDVVAQRVPRVFQFDGGVRLSAGLAFEFERGVPTVDEAGRAVGPDGARFAREATIASPVEMELVRASNYGTTILGSGLDHDGVTPLLVVRDSSLNVIDVFASAGDGLMQAEATGVGRARTSLGAAGIVDIMGGAVPNHRYDPRAGVVCHGLIVLSCAVSYQPFPPISAWIVKSTALVVSQDRGGTWQLVHQDVSVQENRERVREWSMQNWWPDEMGAAPTTAYFAAADYRSKPGCDGGRVIAFRATRAAVGAGWVIDPPALLYQTPTTAAGQHVHTAGIFRRGDGLRAIVGIGDTQAFNRVAAVDRADRAVTSSGWSATESYHGAEGVSGNQFVGCAPSAIPGVLILGSDLCQEQLMLLDARGETGRHEWLYGNGWANGLPSQNFVIRTPTPELGGPYCSTYEPQQNSTIFPPGSRRLLYSEDGLAWTQLCAPMNQSTWAAAIHGDHVYVDGDGVSDLGLRRLGLPEAVVTARPLKIGGGGMQRLVPSPAVTPGPGGTVTALTRNGEGLWVDGGVPIEPQPPCMGPVWKMTGTLGASDTRIADIFPIATTDMGGTVDSPRMIGRVWLMNLLPKSMTPRLEIKPNAGAVIETRNTNVTSEGTWAPVDMVISAEMPSGQRPAVRVRSMTGGSDVQAFYLAFDAWGEGEGFPGYATGPDVSGRRNGTAYPDERAAITGIAPSERWTVTLVGMLPWDGIDASVASDAGLNWPLASICVGEGIGAERLVFLAELPSHALRAELWRGGAMVGIWRIDGLVWLRQSPLMLSVSRPGAGSDMEITVAACGMAPLQMERLEPDGNPMTFQGRPTMIRFDDGTGIDGVGVGVHTSPMLWFGGEVLEDAALDAAGRAARMRAMPFLRPDAVRRIR